MDKYINIDSVITWPQATVAIVFLIGILIVPAVINYLQNRELKAAVKASHTTLTQNNGGGSVKDALDAIRSDLSEIKATQKDHSARLVALEAPREHLR